MVHHKRLAVVAARITALRPGSLHFKKRWYLHLVKFCPLKAASTLPISCARHIRVETQRNNPHIRSSWHPFRVDVEEVAVVAMGSRRSGERNETRTSKEADARTTSLSESQPPRDGLANQVSGLDEHDGPSTYRWVVEQHTDMLPPALAIVGDIIDTTLGFQEVDTEGQSGPTQDTENLQALSPGQAATTNTRAIISTNFKDFFVPRDLEMLYENHLRCILDPNDTRRSGEDAHSQETATERCFITPSNHFYRALAFYHSLKPESKLRRSKESRQQRQRGVPTLSIPKFQNLGAFFNWYAETEKMGEERRVNISRMQTIILEGQGACQEGSMARDAKSLQTTEELRQDLDKLRRKGQKWDMQLAALSYCHYVCGRLVASIDRMESVMRRRQALSGAINRQRGMNWREDYGLPSKTATQSDAIGTVGIFIAENRIHQCVIFCEPACSNGLQLWAGRHQQLVLDCINKHAGAVRGKVCGHEASLE